MKETHDLIPERNRILIVDDEHIVLTALRETLRLEGYEVVATSDPLKAFEEIQRTRFAVILTDQQMPVLTGLEFLAQAKEIQPHATRILITAVLSLNTVIDAINKGEIYRFIVKPWLREELIVTVKNAANRYELLVGNQALQRQAVQMNMQMAEQLKQLNTSHEKLALLNAALQDNLDRSVQVCVRIAETFYPLLGAQARRVLEVSRTLANACNLSPEERKILEISSQLYDIGLVGTPRELIRKWQVSPESLSEAERGLIELHPTLGQELVRFSAELAPVGTIIRAHHERYDGQGYPDRLAGEQIPWLARLLAVAVAYACHPGGGNASLEHVKAASGGMLDPEAVRLFLRSLPTTVMPQNQREVLLSELAPGMVLAAGIYTSNGLLIIPEGQVLNRPHIEKIRNHNLVSPITQVLRVYC